MQKLIAKYGLAAHLAILAVAPLFLFPYFNEGEIATAMLWLSLLAVIWTLLGPSVRGGEMLHQARQRVFRSIMHDPLFWTLMAIGIVAGVRAINQGIELAYDPEKISWFVKEPMFPILPGVVGTGGYLPFAGVVAIMVVVASARHALGKSARMSFLFLASLMAGLSGIVAVFLVNQNYGDMRAMSHCTYLNPSFIGTAFGVYLLMATVALLYAIESKWTRMLPLSVPAIAGTAVGVFGFAPPLTSGSFVATTLLVAAMAFLYACLVVRGASEFKFFIFFLMAAALAVAMVMFVMPQEVYEPTLSAFMAMQLWPDNFWETRSVLSSISLRTWMAHLWVGSGLGAFPLDIRFNALPAEWPSIPPGTVAVTNGGWQLLAERGVVGAALLALPILMLFFTYVRRMVGGIKARRVPHPTVLVGPLAVVVLAVVSAFECSLMRVEVLMAASVAMALSAGAFPREKN